MPPPSGKVQSAQGRAASEAEACGDLHLLEIARAPVLQRAFGIHIFQPDIEAVERRPDDIGQRVPALVGRLVAGQQHRIVGAEVGRCDCGADLRRPEMAERGKARIGEKSDRALDFHFSVAEIIIQISKY